MGKYKTDKITECNSTCQWTTVFSHSGRRTVYHWQEEHHKKTVLRPPTANDWIPGSKSRSRRELTRQVPYSITSSTSRFCCPWGSHLWSTNACSRNKLQIAIHDICGSISATKIWDWGSTYLQSESNPRKPHLTNWWDDHPETDDRDYNQLHVG